MGRGDVMTDRLPEPTSFQNTEEKEYLNQLLRVLRNNLDTLENGVIETTDVKYPSSAKIGDPIHLDNVQEIINHLWSAGVTHDCPATSNGSGGLNIGSGYAMLRDSADAHTVLHSVEINAQDNIALTNNAVNYVYLDWNSGSPQFVANTALSSFNCLDKCVAFEVHRSDNILKINDITEQNVDANRKVRRWLLRTKKYHHYEGGSLLSESGTLGVAVTSGIYSLMMEEIPHVAFDTNIAGTDNANVFTLSYRDGASGHTFVADSKVIDTTKYDDNSGTLATLDNNKWGVAWFYINHNTPSSLNCVLGQAQYPNQSEAETATAPSDVPSLISDMSSLVAFVVFQKSVVTFDDILNVSDTVFIPSSVTAHNNLSGLNVGDYIHLTAVEYAALGGITSINKQVFTSSGTYTPTSGMLYCEIEATGGGGGSYAATGYATGGGGGGETSKSVLTAAQIGASKTVTIGAGGGVAGDGGNTSLSTLVIANGGIKGSPNGTSSAGGLGGSGGTGDLKINGQQGGYGGENYLIVGGYGGSSLHGHGGSMTTSISASINAISGVGYGAGAGGACENGTGATGTAGIITVTEYVE